MSVPVLRVTSCVCSVAHLGSSGLVGGGIIMLNNNRVILRHVKYFRECFDSLTFPGSTIVLTVQKRRLSYSWEAKPELGSQSLAQNPCIFCVFIFLKCTWFCLFQGSLELLIET